MSLKNFPSFLLDFSECHMQGGNGHSYEFNSFQLNLAERRLLNDSTPVPLTPKAFDVLAVLVERAGHLVEKEELMQLVWPDSFVEESNAARIVHTLRKVLGEHENSAKFIETVAKKGYRFVAPVHEVREPSQFFPQGDHVPAVSENLFGPETFVPPEAAIEAVVPDPSKLQRPATRFTLIAGGFLSAIALISWLSFDFQPASSVGADEVKSIAVLPFKSLAAENRDPRYELGIADSLNIKLGAAQGLHVRASTSTSMYAGVEQDPVAAGKEQQVDYVLSSNYQLADGKIRITSQLINVLSGRVEEVFKDEQDTSNTFAMQDAVAANIGRSLLKKLNRTSKDIPSRRYTTNEEAYRLYLLGSALADKQTRESGKRAIAAFEAAVKLDPNYARAYAALANIHSVTAFMGGGGNPTEEYLQAKAAVEKALSIDVDLAEAHSYLGEIKANYEWDLAGAEREHKWALELDPNSAAAHRMYALLLGLRGRRVESIAEIKTAIDLEPASVLNHKIFTQLLYYARRYDEAIAEGRRTVELDPDFISTYDLLVGSYRLKGDEDQAFEWFLKSEQTEEDREKIQLWRSIYAISGWRGVVERQLEEAKKAEKNGSTNPVPLARLYSKLGDNDQAFAYLEKAFSQRRWAIVSLDVNPNFDSLRSDPRYEELMRRARLR